MTCNHEISILLPMFKSTMVTSIVLIHHIKPYIWHQWLKHTFIYPLGIFKAGALTREAGLWHSYRARVSAMAREQIPLQ